MASVEWTDERNGAGRMKRHVWITCGVVVMLGLAGCSQSSGGGSVPDPTESSDSPFLSVRDEPDGPILNPAVGGVIQVNEHNCVVLDDRLISAPPGSEVIDGGTAVVLATVGTYRFGEEVLAGGIRTTIDELDMPELRDASVRCGTPKVVIIYSGRS